MAEESAMSTAESGVPPPPGAAGTAIQAEVITKKLANYWCLIGSIPLILFLLVAVPTILYVKKFSEYVNAEYCGTKSCKDLADVILKMGSTHDACTSFSKHVCKAKADYALETLNKIHSDIDKFTPKDGDPGLATFARAKAFLLACPEASKDFPQDNDGRPVAPIPEFPEGLDYEGRYNAAELAANATFFGVDTLVRGLVCAVNYTDGTPDTPDGGNPLIELSAPTQDFYHRMLLNMAGKTYMDVAKFLQHPDDEDILPKIDPFRKKLDAFILSKTRTAKQNMPIVIDVGDLDRLIGPTWSWSQYLLQLKLVVKEKNLIRLMHPEYLLGLGPFIEEETTKDPFTRALVNVVQQIDAYLAIFGHLAIPDFPAAKKKAACVMLTERTFPGAIGHGLLYQRATQFGAPNGINPGGSSIPAMSGFLDSEVRQMLDSMTFSYALSTSATEENRVGFYRQVQKMNVAPGFFNTSDGLYDDAMKSYAGKVPEYLDDVDTYDFVSKARQDFMFLYWKILGKNNPTKNFRNPFDPLYATYLPSENFLYVPMGVFTKPVFRNSQRNRIFAATSGYLVMTGVMRALTMTGSMVVKNQLSFENWVGYSWTRKMEKYTDCLQADRKDNGTIETTADVYMVAAVTPALRYFKKLVFQKAFPRPEFRIDWVSDLSSTQLFFYNWALLHCGSPAGQELIDIAARNNPYFAESFGCEKGSKMIKLDPCFLWNTTRRHY
ncbi:uncharacterized protein [Dermacentor albipictus]|uniref:uncharacterized protein n=1 Tax=Dermacentor albipictus TaxID=60249 RepID=UPI0031FE3035